jgi:sec-independent protein translocase protein TatC
MTVDPESEIEASRAPLLEHLTELRNRLIVCIIALIIGFGICFAFADQIFTALLHPFQVANGLVALQKISGNHSALNPELLMA